jgi:hypothetical protein
MTVSGLGVRDADDFERVLADFAQDGNGGLIVTPSPLTATKRDVLIGVAEKLKLPTVYPFRFYVESGGLVSRRLTSIASCVVQIRPIFPFSCQQNSAWW